MGTPRRDHGIGTPNVGVAGAGLDGDTEVQKDDVIGPGSPLLLWVTAGPPHSKQFLPNLSMYSSQPTRLRRYPMPYFPSN